MRVETVDYQAPDAGETLARSLRDTGFAVLANHPITPERIAGIYDGWGHFSQAMTNLNLPSSRRHMMAILPFARKTPKIHKSRI